MHRRRGSERRRRYRDRDADQCRIGRSGTPTAAHPTVTSRGSRLLPIDSRYDKANARHTDVTFVYRVPKASLLRAISDDYSTDLDVRLAPVADTVREYREEFVSEYYETEHPVVRVHPETGRRVLLLGQFVTRFVGLGSTESAALFGLLQTRITKLENTVRWNWKDGDLAIWDNRATQHYAVSDYDDQYRRLNRVTLAGDIPVDVYGRESRIVAGDASAYSDVVVPAPRAS